MSALRASTTMLTVLILAACGGDDTGASQERHRVGGTVSLPAGAEVVLQLDGGQELPLAASGAFRFPVGVAEGAGYSVTVAAAPAALACTVAAGTGTVGRADVVGVAVTCAWEAHAVGGTVAGLTGTIELELDGTLHAVSADGSFTFPGPVKRGDRYAVHVRTQPAEESCGVDRGWGTMAGADVTDVAVTCTPAVLERPAFTVAAGVKQLRFSWAPISGATVYRLFTDRGDGPGFVQLGGDLTGTVYDLDVSVHRQPWAAARFRLDACDGSTCTSSNELPADAMLGAIGYFKASNTGSSDGFGFSVALSADGSTLAVGASGEKSGATGIGGAQTDTSAPGAGAVYVY